MVAFPKGFKFGSIFNLLLYALVLLILQCSEHHHLLDLLLEITDLQL